MNPEHQLAPHSAELEEALLGSILTSEVCLTWDNVKLVKPTDFFILKNKIVFEAISELHRRGEVIDYLTVIDEMRRNPEQFEMIGRSAYITYLLNSTPTYLNADTYAAIIRSAGRRREALQIATEIAQAAIGDSPEDFEDQFRRMEQVLTERKQGQTTTHLVHVSELKNMPTVSWLIPGEIPESGLVVLFGPSGIGKSFVALDYAMRLAKDNSVVYVAAEGESGYLLRSSAWCTHHKVNDESLNLHFYMNIVSLLDKTERSTFINTLRPAKPRFVIVDTLALCMLPGDENSTRDMGMFIKASKELRTALDCSVMLVHHTNKEGRAERGNSALRAASDIMIRVTGEDDVIRIECSKTKDAKTFPTKYAKLLPVETPYGSSPVIIASEKIVTSKDDEPSQNQLKILEALAMDVFSNGATAPEIIDHTELTKPTVYRALSTLANAGRIIRDQESKYRLTENGRSLTSLTQSHASLTPVYPHQQTPVSKSHENYTSEIPNLNLQNRNSSETLRLQSNGAKNRGETDRETDETGETDRESNNETRPKQPLQFGPPKPKAVCHRCKTDSWVIQHDGSWRCKLCSEKDARNRQLGID